MFAQMGLFIFTSGLTMVTLFPITSSKVVQDVATHQLRPVAVYKGLFKATECEGMRRSCKRAILVALVDTLRF